MTKKNLILIIAGVVSPVLFSAQFAHATTLITWTSGMTDDLMANITGVITDLSPLIIPIIGIGVGLIVVESIISAIRGHH